MEPTSVALIQVESPRDETPESRVARVSHLVTVAARDGAQLVVLPELWVSGYLNFEAYDDNAQPIDGPFVAEMSRLAKSNDIYLAAGSFIERTEAGDLHNTALLFNPAGDVILRYRKVHVFGYQSLEAEILTAGDRADVVATELGNIGLTTCYDLRFPELYRQMLDAGAEVVIVPSAWPHKRTYHWQVLTAARAIENQTYLLACNAGGFQGRTQLGGDSRIIDPWGEITARGGQSAETIWGEISLDHLKEVRSEFPVLGDRRIE